ncbi:helix-turn-helix domain-containing protein [Actinoplanes sp. RD1]|uniref:helix-turn-helix domain-containing protein n=1 Tax=Actinoplanes sp. RD1 TaxID=3064538 RepID=UPI0027403B05|nr:helix-turn-helix transcriptional regulator [Actinoplanes sp. RD1]
MVIARVVQKQDPADPARLLRRARATTGTDEALAGTLQALADRTPPATAATALRHAARVTANPRTRENALVAAARQTWLAGAPGPATALLRAAGPRARTRLVAAEIALHTGPGGADELIAAAVHLPPAQGVEALLHAADALHRAGDDRRFAEVARLVLARHPEPTPAAELVAGLAALCRDDQATGFARLRAAQARAAASGQDLVQGATAAVLTGADGLPLAGRAVRLIRQRGETALLPRALEAAAFAALATGQHDAATTAATEGAELAARTGQPVLAEVHLGILAVLAALAGDRETTLLRVRQAAAQDSTTGPGSARALCQWALSVLDLIDGRTAAAAGRLAGLVVTGSGHGNAVLQVAATPHLVEAAPGGVPAGVLGPFERWTTATGRAPWLALRARCRALLATDPDDAEDLFREALAEHDRGDTDYARARTEFLYGRHLRAHRRPADAREHLRRATDTFTLLGAGPWAGQAAAELRAAGASVPAVPGKLTAQQERIARLAADGATTREIAQQLVLSPRTVDHHLRNVFARLGVRSRTELARRLPLTES